MSKYKTGSIAETPKNEIVINTEILMANEVIEANRSSNFSYLPNEFGNSWHPVNTNKFKELLLYVYAMLRIVTYVYQLSPQGQR